MAQRWTHWHQEFFGCFLTVSQAFCSLTTKNYLFRSKRGSRRTWQTCNLCDFKVFSFIAVSNKPVCCLTLFLFVVLLVFHLPWWWCKILELNVSESGKLSLEVVEGYKGRFFSQFWRPKFKVSLRAARHRLEDVSFDTNLLITTFLALRVLQVAQIVRFNFFS